MCRDFYCATTAAKSRAVVPHLIYSRPSQPSTILAVKSITIDYLQKNGTCKPYATLNNTPDNNEVRINHQSASLHVGQVPYAMRPDTLRWVLRELTGVTALKVEQRREPKTRGRTGLFTVRVRAQDVDAVVAWHRRALCCPEFLWVPLRGCAEEAEALCARLKGDGIGVKNGLLSIERRRLKPGTVPVEDVGLHIIESEQRRPLLWQTLRVRDLCAPTRVRGDESLTCQMIQ
jgi:hypothetical protein